MRLILLTGLTLLIAQCASAPKTFEQHVEINPGFTAHRYKDIYFSAQPDLTSMDDLRRAGFASVVNLRQPKEGNYKANDEKRAVEWSKLHYAHIPMSVSAPLTDELINRVTAAVVKNRKAGKTLIHCSSGQRAALWAGGHFYKDHNYNKDDAIKVAKTLGLNKPQLQTSLENYLMEQEKY